MKHYIVICLWKTGEGEGVNIVGVRHSYDEAKELYDKELDDVITDADDWEMDYDYEKDGMPGFEAYGNYWHPSNYIKLYIANNR